MSLCGCLPFANLCPRVALSVFKTGDPCRMKIRTRLMLCLLPILIGSIALVITLLSLRLHDEILDGYNQQLKMAALTAAKLPVKDEPVLQKIGTELGLAELVFIPLGGHLPSNPLAQIAPVLD